MTRRCERGFSIPGFRQVALILAWAGLAVSTPPPATAESRQLSFVEVPSLPVGQGAQEPALFALNDGRILMIWTEPTERGHAVRVAFRDRIGWSNPVTVVDANDLFVNWADFPTVAAFADGTLAVAWLRETDRAAFAYDINMALSKDEGRTWGDTFIPHSDRSASQHGFVTLLPVDENRLMAIWLDGSAYGKGAVGAVETGSDDEMQLRATHVLSDGAVEADVALDLRTCSCCQTSAALAGDGSVLVVYRDRSPGEVRDISVVRMTDGQWSDPVKVHADDWVISGCPVNGPAIDARGTDAVVAWFTAANDVPAVKVAFSTDAGVHFSDTTRIDLGEAAGRVDVVQLEGAEALVSWVEWTSVGEALFLCRVNAAEGCRVPQLVTLNREAGSINFPRMVRTTGGIYVAWSQPAGSWVTEPTIRMVFAPVE